MEFKNSVALITGGSRGVGKFTSIKFAEEGADIAINYHTNTEAANKTKEIIEDLGVKAKAYRCDVSDYKKVSHMMRKLKEDFGKLNVLVNNAGIIKQEKTEEMGEKTWDRVINVNLKGVFNCSRHAIPLLKENGGRIVNVASISGQTGGNVGTNYAASKGGVISFTKAISKEVVKYGILVNAVAPGPVDMGAADKETLEALRKLNLLKRVMHPREVAEAIFFMAKTDHMTGQTLNLNCGRYMG